MQVGWSECRLGELFDIKHGYAFKGQHFAATGDYILLTPGNFKAEGGLKLKGESEKYYLGDFPRDFLLGAGDLLVAMTDLTQDAPILGSPLLVPEDDRFLHNQRLGKVVNIREDRVTRDFLFYLFCTPLVRAQIKASASGATVRHTSPSRIGEVRASLPSIPMQNRLVEVLSAYDDLVANNLRRMQILEEMSHAVYREWFDEFRAPGVADVSDSGLPAGWHRLPLREAVEVSPKVAVPRDGEKPFVPMGCLSNDSMIIDGVESRTGNSGSKFQNGDTLFARITPCLENGKTGFVQFLPDSESVAFGSTEFIVLRSKTLTPEFVYLLARSDEVRGPAIKSMSGASGRQRVQEQCFDSMTVVQPPPDLLERFTDIVRPMFRLVHQLHLQNQSLRRTRDLLLPRLMSGQLSLPDASDQPPVLSAPESAAP